jgi:hypothetical protein
VKYSSGRGFRTLGRLLAALLTFTNRSVGHGILRYGDPSSIIKAKWGTECPRTSRSLICPSL